jgi:hypothetical protein
LFLLQVQAIYCKYWQRNGTTLETNNKIDINVADIVAEIMPGIRCVNGYFTAFATQNSNNLILLPTTLFVE